MNKAISASVVLCAMAMTGAASAEVLGDPPNVALQNFSSNSNDGYSSFRGVVFRADQNFTINDVGWWNDMPQGVTLNFELWQAGQFPGQVTNGGQLLATASMQTSLAGLVAHQAVLNQPVQASAGTTYLVRVSHNGDGLNNWFYNYDNSDPNGGFAVGRVTVLDGTLGGGTGNTVMPKMEINEIPAPGAAALLALGGIAAGRRRR